jgi:lipopolysaccharide transport system permease protein
MVIFGTIAKLGDDGLPSMAFYLSGVILWNYFSACLTSTATTFTANAGIFGKVYFPRLISPLSVVVSNLMKFGIQFLFFISVIIYFKLTGDQKIQVTWYVLLAPLFIAMMALLGLSMGLIISSLTTKYRDLSHLVTFGVQLLMYATPVVYPLSKVSDNAKFYLLLNPMTSIIEGFRFAFLGKGTFSPSMLLYSGGVILCMLFIGVIIFSRVEKNFMDTV